MSAENTVTVTHNAAEGRFEAEVDGAKSMAEYELQGDRIIFLHTFVPSKLRGRGIAEKLVRTGLEHARAKNLKVVPACSYVAAFIAGHAEYKPLLAMGAVRRT